MRDLLPPEASLRRAIARAFLGRAELFGYEPVIPPAFEYAQTIERGLGTLDPREIVRFVEPETGEVVALRPDVTPQIARLVATRFDGRPRPYRLAYDASVLRRRFGSRARTHRQISQLGLELIGVHPVDGDVELLVLAATALESMGLRAFTLDLGHAEIARALLAGVEPSRAAEIAEALAKKDRADLARLARGLEWESALVALPDLHGDPSILDQLPEPVANGPAAAAIADLRGLITALGAWLRAESSTAAAITVDLCEVRGLAYYTGPFYQLFAEGPGVAIGAGGRYDQLLSRFDRPMPASGLAVDVDALLWALRVADAPLLRRPKRVVVTGEGAEAFARMLRAKGIPTAVAGADAEAYATSWGYAAVARIEGARVSIRTNEQALGAPVECASFDAALAALESS
jgi:ATP phosphoribosyltransferase regulatory subunit